MSNNIPTFSDVVNRVKYFRHKHCNRPQDEEVPLGFLAEMSYALGHETSFRLVKPETSNTPTPEELLKKLRHVLGNVVRFIENDGGVFSERNLKQLQDLAYSEEFTVHKS